MRLMLSGLFLVITAQVHAATTYWYYCDPTHTFYPYVQTCSVPWRAVVPYSYKQTQPQAAPAAAPTAPAQVAPVPTTAAPTETQPSPAFRQGQTDRQAWETWFGALTGDYRAGAEWWAGERSLPQPESCNAAPRSTGADWTAGCIAAQQRLVVPDERRKTEPDYWRGWNSLPATAANTATKEPAPLGQQTMAEVSRPGGAETTSVAPPAPKAEPPPPERVQITSTASPPSPATPARAPTDEGGTSASASSGLPVLAISAVVVIGVILFLVFKIYRKRVLTGKVTKAVYATINQHKRALVRRRFQTLRHDDYGNLVVEAWQKELLYFIEKVLDPAIRQLGAEEYVLYENMRPALLLTIAQLIEEQAGSSASFTLGPNLTPTDYEQYCAQQLRAAGWSANTTKASGDQGTDIIAQKGDRRLVVQCKLYNHPVGNKAVQEAAAARAHEQAEFAAVVSNSQYTSSAQQLAATNKVLLLHHSDLSNIDDFFSA
jgi:restriction system protein